MPQEIQLRFEPAQSRYVLSFPLHPLQQVVSGTDDEIEIILAVYDTHELRTELLSYGPDVKMLAPSVPCAGLGLPATHLAAMPTEQ